MDPTTVDIIIFWVQAALIINGIALPLFLGLRWLRRHETAVAERETVRRHMAHLQREKEHERALFAMRAEHAECMMDLRRQARREGLWLPDEHADVFSSMRRWPTTRPSASAPMS